MTDPAGAAPPQALYGPFFRLESDTQTAEDAKRQEETGENWGTIPFGSDWPKVEAYLGTLPSDRAGIEFYTSARPDPGGHPTQPRWSGNGRNSDVRTDGKFAKIPCTITVNRQEGA